MKYLMTFESFGCGTKACEIEKETEETKKLEINKELKKLKNVRINNGKMTIGKLKKRNKR